MAKNGYTRLKARYEEQAKQLAELEKKYTNDCGSIRAERDAYMRKVSNLQEEVERLNRARENTRHTIENLMDREAWLLRHTLGIIRFWYVKHFGL